MLGSPRHGQRERDVTADAQAQHGHSGLVVLILLLPGNEIPVPSGLELQVQRLREEVHQLMQPGEVEPRPRSGQRLVSRVGGQEPRKTLPIVRAEAADRMPKEIELFQRRHILIGNLKAGPRFNERRQLFGVDQFRSPRDSVGRVFHALSSFVGMTVCTSSCSHRRSSPMSVASGYRDDRALGESLVPIRNRPTIVPRSN